MQELTDEVIGAVLERNGIGVLALHGSTYPYQIPMCYGYVADDDRLVVQLTTPDGSRKMECLDANRTASLTVYEETDPGNRWQSVVVRGTLTEGSYADAERAFAALARNTQSVPNPISWADPTTRTELMPCEFDIEERSGREFIIG
jgi:nitroimidazol reductase NimA-like FMN-containing flavoprotein (pyridoxamine 5'-phosphate oxidase superfamily)